MFRNVMLILIMSLVFIQFLPAESYLMRFADVHEDVRADAMPVATTVMPRDDVDRLRDGGAVAVDLRPAPIGRARPRHARRIGQQVVARLVALDAIVRRARPREEVAVVRAEGRAAPRHGGR